MDNKENIGGQDRKRISLSEDYEVRYWSEKFGVTEQELRDAVEANGSDQADEIERYLSGRTEG